MAARLKELLAAIGISLTTRQQEQLEGLVVELLRWNQRRNLTAITSPDEVYEKHLIDSLTLFPYAEQANRLLDLGSGAGFPALPLKIACPGLEVVAVDAVAKKVAFQRHVARTLNLSGYTAVHSRAEALPALSLCAPGFDLVTARALGDLSLLATLARPCLAPGGRLVAMKGAEVAEELRRYGANLAARGWIIQTKDLTLPYSGARRLLVEMNLVMAEKHNI